MKKILAILLTVCMVVCMIPGAAFAGDSELKAENVTIGDLLYNSKVQTPTVSILDETNSSNYSVIYEPNEIKNAGTYKATVKITGENSKYKKDAQVEKTFCIIPVDFEKSMDIEKTTGFVSEDIEKGKVKDDSLNDIVVKQGGGIL